MSELNFTRAEYDLAAMTSDEATLALLADHASHYVRARVAGNSHTPRLVRDALRERAAKHTGVLVWLLGNPSCRRDEFAAVYAEYIGQTYNGNAHISLASSRHATTNELSTLLRLDAWAVTMAVLNNYQHRNVAEFRNMIKKGIPPPDEELKWEKWSDVQKLAHFRTTGQRRPASTD